MSILDKTRRELEADVCLYFFPQEHSPDALLAATAKLIAYREAVTREAQAALRPLVEAWEKAREQFIQAEIGICKVAERTAHKNDERDLYTEARVIRFAINDMREALSALALPEEPEPKEPATSGLGNRLKEAIASMPTVPTPLKSTADRLEEAWGIIANVTPWAEQSKDWQAAAKRFRDAYVAPPAPAEKVEAERAPCVRCGRLDGPQETHTRPPFTPEAHAFLKVLAEFNALMISQGGPTAENMAVAAKVRPAALAFLTSTGATK